MVEQYIFIFGGKSGEHVLGNLFVYNTSAYANHANADSPLVQRTRLFGRSKCLAHVPRHALDT